MNNSNSAASLILGDLDNSMLKVATKETCYSRLNMTKAIQDLAPYLTPTPSSNDAELVDYTKYSIDDSNKDTVASFISKEVYQENITSYEKILLCIECIIRSSDAVKKTLLRLAQDGTGRSGGQFCFIRWLSMAIDRIEDRYKNGDKPSEHEPESRVEEMIVESIMELVCSFGVIKKEKQLVTLNTKFGLDWHNLCFQTSIFATSHKLPAIMKACDKAEEKLNSIKDEKAFLHAPKPMPKIMIPVMRRKIPAKTAKPALDTTVSNDKPAIVSGVHGETTSSNNQRSSTFTSRSYSPQKSSSRPNQAEVINIEQDEPNRSNGSNSFKVQDDPRAKFSGSGWDNFDPEKYKRPNPGRFKKRFHNGPRTEGTAPRKNNSNQDYSSYGYNTNRYSNEHNSATRPNVNDPSRGSRNTPNENISRNAPRETNQGPYGRSAPHSNNEGGRDPYSRNRSDRDYDKNQDAYGRSTSHSSNDLGRDPYTRKRTDRDYENNAHHKKPRYDHQSSYDSSGSGGRGRDEDKNGGRGRGRGRTLPAWQTQGKQVASEDVIGRDSYSSSAPSNMNRVVSDNSQSNGQESRGRGRGRTLPSWMTKESSNTPPPVDLDALAAKAEEAIAQVNSPAPVAPTINTDNSQADDFKAFKAAMRNQGKNNQHRNYNNTGRGRGRSNNRYSNQQNSSSYGPNTSSEAPRGRGRGLDMTKPSWMTRGGNAGQEEAPSRQVSYQPQQEASESQGRGRGRTLPAWMTKPN